MGILKFNQREGAGIYENTPRKKGVARYFEILEQDMGKCFKSQFLCLLFCIPFGVFYFLAWLSTDFTQNIPFLLSICAIAFGGALGGIGIANLFDTLLRAYRDEAGIWSLNWKKSMAQNHREAIAAGMITALFVLFYLFAYHILSEAQAEIGAWIVYVITFALISVCLEYFYFQICTLQLSAGARLKNSLLFLFSYAPRSLAAGAVNVFFFLLFYAFVPYSLFFVVLFGFWLPLSISGLILYAPYEKKMDLENQIKKLHEEEQHQGAAET
jgi:hypothetical protein